MFISRFIRCYGNAPAYFCSVSGFQKKLNIYSLLIKLEWIERIEGENSLERIEKKKETKPEWNKWKKETKLELIERTERETNLEQIE